MLNRFIVLSSVVLGTLLGMQVSGAIASEGKGYVLDSRGVPVRSGSGLCWRTGYWTPAMASPECDPDLVKPKAVEKPPVAKPANKVTPSSPPPAKAEAVALSADSLFAFGKSDLLPESKTKLGSIGERLRGAKFSRVTVVGYTDRIGSQDHNLHLSKARADSVKAFLVSKGVDGARIVTIGKGSADPQTSSKQCKGKKSPTLIRCLQPDRRVEIVAVP